MKVNIDYNLFHKAVGFMEKDIPLWKEQRETILAVLKAVQGDYVPTKEELNRHEANVKALSSMDIHNPSWDRVCDECRDFENKYC